MPPIVLKVNTSAKTTPQIQIPILITVNILTASLVELLAVCSVLKFASKLVEYSVSLRVTVCVLVAFLVSS